MRPEVEPSYPETFREAWAKLIHAGPGATSARRQQEFECGPEGIAFSSPSGVKPNSGAFEFRRAFQRAQPPNTIQLVRDHGGTNQVARSSFRCDYRFISRGLWYAHVAICSGKAR